MKGHNRWKRREAKYRKKRYGMKVDGAQVKRIWLDFIYKQQKGTK